MLTVLVRSMPLIVIDFALGQLIREIHNFKPAKKHRLIISSMANNWVVLKFYQLICFAG